MWLGESERIVRDLFAKARARRKEGALPFIFIDEAESVLGTRRSMRSFNINNTLVPMFCAEMDGIESLQDVVIILASNRPDLIDPAVLRPGRIDRKIKVARPNREAAVEILSVYLTSALPLDQTLLDRNNQDHAIARRAVIEQVVEQLFSRTDQNRVLSIRLRNGQNKILYRAISSAARSSLRSCSGRRRRRLNVRSPRPGPLRRRHPDAGFARRGAGGISRGRDAAAR